MAVHVLLVVLTATFSNSMRLMLGIGILTLLPQQRLPQPSIDLTFANIEAISGHLRRNCMKN
jgi:hypothetical protein